MAPVPSFERVRDSTSSEFDELCRIYETSIAARERKSREGLAAMVERSDYEAVVLKLDGATVGFSVTFQADSFVLLEYLAIRDGLRGSGLGSLLFRHFGESANAPVLLEVDAVSEDARTEDAALQRQRFYRRMGCRRLEEVHYMLPLPGEGPPPAMDLFAWSKSSLDRVSRSTLREWLETIYTRVYGAAARDVRISKTLSDLPQEIRLV